MEKEEKRKKLEDEYFSKRRGLIEKIDKCEDLQECENIMKEFRDMVWKIEGQDRELYLSLIGDIRKFEAFCMRRRGGLGGRGEDIIWG